MIIQKITNRIRDRNRRRVAVARNTVDIDEWLERMSEYLYFFEATSKIPSPWGFLDAPLPWNTMPQIRDIFVDEQYRCDFDVPPKRILDCGGNVGLSVLYFTKTFAEVQVEVYEANPILAATIQRNCHTAGVADRVRVSATAVADKTGTLHFASSGDDSGHISSEGELVPCVDIAELVGEELDLLKMDIEGAEFACFQRLADTGKLGVPKRIVAEIHLENNDAERLVPILMNLKALGFMVTIRGDLGNWTGPATSTSPFRAVGRNKSFIHLYAWK